MKHLFVALLLLMPLRPARSQVTLFNGENFSRENRTFGVGEHSLANFDDLASSIRVTPGYVAVLYEHKDEKGGYGLSVDLLEDHPILSDLRFDNKASFVSVFLARKGNVVYSRARVESGTFMAGHWERQGAMPGPSNTVAVVAPPIIRHQGDTKTTLQTNGAVTMITNLGILPFEASSLFERANKQLGIIGNDYRGPQELGSACIQRASNNLFIPDNLNFWYPQRRKRDHRNVVFYKHTLAGTVKEAQQENISGTYQDYDVTIHITPDADYNYLVTDAHRREFTKLMKAEYAGTRVLPLIRDQGQHDCNDTQSRSEFTSLEAEIAPEQWPKGKHLFGRSRLADLCLQRVGQKMCVYGPWIYDEGHCCHPEIHPAEQLWWSSPLGSGRQYNCNVVCDASGRFWWRSQMDDGTKLKPWAEPPIRGLFAIAFEVPLAATTSLQQVGLKFEVDYLDHYNLIEYPNADQVYTLVHAGKPIVTFVPHNNAFKVSFENIGLDQARNSVKGFLVIETSVGFTRQIATKIFGPDHRLITVPPNSQPKDVPQAFERNVFKKEGGMYFFTVTQSETRMTVPPPNAIGTGN